MNKVAVKPNDLIIVAPIMQPDDLCNVCVVRSVDAVSILVTHLATAGDNRISRNRHFRVIGHISSLELYYKNYDDPKALNG